MSAHTPAGPYSDVFEHSGRIRIADLNPDLTTLHNLYLEAIIVLVWPYSSSSQKLSLLLAEKDIRLRKSKGQAKITLYGECAREVAKLQAGIGDNIRLGLKDLIWTRTGEAVSTPGKKLDWDLELRRSVKLEIRHRNEQINIIDFRARLRSQSPDVNILPAVKHVNGLRVSRELDPGSLQAPAFRTPKRVLSGSYVDKVLSPFTDNHGSYGGRSGKRTKYARPSGTWYLLDDSEDEGDQVKSNPPPSSLLNSTESADHETRTQDAQVAVEHIVHHLPTGSPDVSIETEEAGIDESTTGGIPREHHDLEPVLSPHEKVPPQSMTPLTAPEDEIQVQHLPYPNVMISPEDHADPQSAVGVIQPMSSPPLPFAVPDVHTDLHAGTEFFSTEFSPSMPSIENVHDDTEPMWPSILQPQYYPESLTEIIGQSHEDENAPLLVLPSPPKSDPPFPHESNTLGDEDVRSHDMTDPVLPPLYSAELSVSHTSPDDYVAAFVDLDALQEEVERESMRDTADQTQIDVVENPDMYGSSAKMTASASLQLLSRLQDIEEAPKESPNLSLDQQDQSNVSSGQVRGQDEITDSNFPNRTQQQLDGVRDLHEPEDERIGRRTQLLTETAAEISNELVEISSEDEGRRRTISPARELPAQTTMSSLYRNGAEELVSQSDLVRKTDSFAHANQMSPVESDRATDSLEAKIDTERDAESIIQIPTPVATQQTPTIERHVRLQETTEQVILPLSPTLTQDVPQSSLPKPTDLQKPREEPQLPEMMSTDEPVKPGYRSNRLSRKFGSSDPIGNEYFTPRRSRRASRARLDEFTDGLTSDPAPSSPTETRRSKQTPPIAESADSHTHNMQQKLSNAHVYSSKSHRGLSTPLSYYPRLSLLHEFHGRDVDIMAICTTASPEPQKATSGPRDYHITLHLVDASFSDRTTITVQIFRPRRFALPVALRGDVVILRDMKVQSQEGKSMLLSTETSSWAVLRNDKETQGQISVTMNGPPVEYGEAEMEYVEYLSTWWNEEADTMQYPPPEQKPPSKIVLAAQSPPSKQRRRRRASAASGSILASIKDTSPERANETAAIKETAAGSEVFAGKEAAIAAASSTRMTRSRRRKSIHESRDNIGTVSLTQSDPKAAPGAEATAQHNAEEQSPLKVVTSKLAGKSHKTGAGAIVDSNIATRSPTNVVVSATGNATSPRRQRRRRGKSMSTQPSANLVHELRDGTKYVDVEGFGGSSGNAGSRRNINTNINTTNQEDADTAAQKAKRNNVQTTNIVHELRDGHRYIDP